jgi:hypothetical protein
MRLGARLYMRNVKVKCKCVHVCGNILYMSYPPSQEVMDNNIALYLP